MIGRGRNKFTRDAGYFALLLIGCTVFILAPERVFQRTPSLSLVHAMARELVRGHLNGAYQGHPNSMNASLLEPGDVIVCHNPGGGYGYWTHAVVYVGRGQVVDANDFARGTEVRNVENYRFYDRVVVLRAVAPASVRLRAAESALQEVGKAYDPFSALSDLHSEYCSKLIWRVYDEQGIRLCSEKSWVLPDDLASSTQLRQVACWQATTSRGR